MKSSKKAKKINYEITGYCITYCHTKLGNCGTHKVGSLYNKLKFRLDKNNLKKLIKKLAYIKTCSTFALPFTKYRVKEFGRARKQRLV
jgi:hypothetical protein